MEKKSDVTNAGRPARKRELNVIYFIDASKTRSLKVSLSVVHALLLALALVVCWSVVSSWWLFQTNQKNNELDTKLSEQLAVIFEYQTRFDGIYEDAYPRFDGSVYDQALAKIDAATASDDQETTGETTTESGTPDGTRGLAAKAPRGEVANEPAAIGVVVDQPKFSRDSSRLSLTFSIRNTNSPARVVGYVYGIAKFITTEGEVSYVISPDILQVNPDGQLGSPRHEAPRFSIRYFRGKTFHFSHPSGKQGRFSEVKVYLSRANGEETSYTLAVDEQYGANDASSSPKALQRFPG